MKTTRHLLLRVDGEAYLVTDVVFDNTACMFYIHTDFVNKQITSELINDVFYETLMAFELVPFIKTEKDGFIEAPNNLDCPVANGKVIKVAHLYDENQ